MKTERLHGDAIVQYFFFLTIVLLCWDTENKQQKIILTILNKEESPNQNKKKLTAASWGTSETTSTTTWNSRNNTANVSITVKTKCFSPLWMVMTELQNLLLRRRRTFSYPEWKLGELKATTERLSETWSTTHTTQPGFPAPQTEWQKVWPLQPQSNH